MKYSSAQTKLKISGDNLSTQIGFSLKVIVELGFHPKSEESFRQNNPLLRFVANAGVGSNFATPIFYPSFNAEIQLYNGGLGSRQLVGTTDRPKWNLDLITAFTLTGGVKNHLKQRFEASYKDRNIPLYYFADFVSPALQNPFDVSISLGTNLVFPLTDKSKKKQRLGFFNLHAYPIQLSYYNDGGIIIGDLYLGDRRDRYYTGGVILSYHGPSNTLLNLVEASYHKFTGYTKNAFEVSNKLYLNFMSYHDTTQQLYNKSLWSLNLASTPRGLGIKFYSYNSVKCDVQHWIHWSMNNAYHMVPYQPHWGMSGSYFTSNTKLGFQ